VIPLTIFGAGGHAREILALVQSINERSATYQLLGWLDDRSDLRGESPLNVPMLGKLEDIHHTFKPNVQVVIAIGSSSARKRIAKRLKKLSIQPATLVHPTAQVGSLVTLHPGTMVCAGALLTTGIEVGAHVVINTGSIVSHDCQIDDYATIAPGANLAGGVRVETGAEVGIGATILPGLCIGSWSIVGAGAVVTKNVPPNSTVVGTPARVIKQRALGWQRE